MCEPIAVPHVPPLYCSCTSLLTTQHLRLHWNLCGTSRSSLYYTDEQLLEECTADLH
jgi:hypothetical protein